MMIMRPPQHGQGCEGVGGSLGSTASIDIVVLRHWHGEQLAGAGDVVGAGRSGEQAVVTDAVGFALSPNYIISCDILSVARFSSPPVCTHFAHGGVHSRTDRPPGPVLARCWPSWRVLPAPWPSCCRRHGALYDGRRPGGRAWCGWRALVAGWPNRSGTARLYFPSPCIGRSK
jgi:hypothetical protein